MSDDFMELSSIFRSLVIELVTGWIGLIRWWIEHICSYHCPSEAKMNTDNAGSKLIKPTGIWTIGLVIVWISLAIGLVIGWIEHAVSLCT